MIRRLLPTLVILAWGAATAGEPLDVVVISDLNGPYGQVGLHPRVRVAVARIIERKPDLVISTGDMVAGQQPHPKLDDQALHNMWTEFHRTVTEPLAAAGIPFAATPGNHDASAYPGYARERAAYARAWADHRPAVEMLDEAGFPFRYAFRFGEAVFVSLDATRMGALPADDMTWLTGILNSPAAASRPTVLFGHLPVWPVAHGRETEYLDDPALRDLLAQTKVRLMLSGHHHAYYAGRHGETAHISQACLGSGPRRLIGTSTVAPRAFTRFTLWPDGRVETDALLAPRYEESLDLTTLPPFIDAPFGRLERLDRAGANP
jgi:predicted phosphodiesterase